MSGAYGKRKGAQGEREFAELLRTFGFEGERQGRQFWHSDGREHEDVTHNIPGIHFEVKRTKEKLDVPGAFRQARREKPDKIPVVAWRANRQPWRVIMDADDWLVMQYRLKQYETYFGDEFLAFEMERRGYENAGD